MPKLTFAKTGQVYDVPAGASFLEFCQENNAPHDFGCTVGNCGTCVLKLEAGDKNVNPITPEELETVEMTTDIRGARLGCQLKINGDITVSAI